MGIMMIIIAVLLIIAIVVIISAQKIKSDKHAHKSKNIPDEPDRNENVY